MERLRTLCYFVARTPIIIGATVAMLLANTTYGWYHAVSHHSVHFGAFEVSLHALTNEVLMAAFFLYAAAEVRESLLPGGVLHGVKRAALPVIATIGGVVGPGVLYLLIAGQILPQFIKGWVVVTATDIAFAVTIVAAIYGTSKHPVALFIMTVAVLDDAIGMMLIPTVYADGVNLPLLAVTIAYATCVPFILRRCGVKGYVWYILIAGVPSWYMFHTLHVEPAMALVPIVFGMPHAKHDRGLFAETMEVIEDELHHMRSTSQTAHPEHIAAPAAGDSLGRMSHRLNLLMWPVMLLFGFVNAGVPITSVGSLTFVILAGLLIGKVGGIVAATRLGMLLFRLQLPAGTTTRDLWVIGAAASIGFTVALFVADIAFTGAAADAARIGALLSLVVGAPLTLACAAALRVGRFKNLNFRA